MPPPGPAERSRVARVAAHSLEYWDVALQRGALLLVLMWLAGNDLRLTLLAVPPVLPMIHADLQLDEKGVAALSGPPVLLLGIAAVPGSLLIARIGPRRALLCGLWLIGLSSALRGVGPSVPVLFGM